MDGTAANGLDLVLRSDLSELQRLAAAVEDFIARMGLPPDLAFSINLCLDELVTNTVTHGYRDRTGDGKTGPHRIRVRLEAVGRELRAEVEDDA
ncbi:ATP-binding protein, partial [Azospirillum sp. B506]|uniref:ATP-binding protein n=1 Tax=Azospirillum sp. B506 TaxID=137721 RepID=UPI0005B2A13F